MPTYDWSSFRLRIPVKARPDQLFQKWTSQNELETWFLRQALFTKPDGNPKSTTEIVAVNDRYQWLWHGWPDDVVENGEILQMDHHLLQFSFGKAGHVTVRVFTENGHTMLELFQDEIPVDEDSRSLYHLGCSKGWVFYLANLKSIIEGGPDLRNKELALKDVINS